jgi:PAS domain S-box-containing protein
VKQETIFLQILDSLPVAVILIRTDSCTIEYINETACTITGVSIGEVVGKPCDGVVCGRLRGSCPVKTKEGVFTNREQHLHSKEGRIVPISRSVQIITIDDTEYVLELFIDQSELKSSQSALLRRDIMLDSLAESMNLLLSGLEEFETAINRSLGVLGTGLNADIGFVFQFSSSFGKERFSPAIKYVWQRDDTGVNPFSPGRGGGIAGGDSLDQDSLFARWIARLNKGDAVCGSLTELGPEERGHVEQFGISSFFCVPLTVSDSPWGGLGFATGSSDYNWDEAVKTVIHSAAESYSAALALKISRDRERGEARRAEKLAVKADTANRSKSRFLASMSHEIRTPLNGLLGFLDLLYDTELNEEQEEYLEDARISAQALRFLINDILDFSKIEAGKIDLEQISFDPAEVMEEVAITLQPSAEEKNNDLTVYIPSDVPSAVIGDPGRFRQILMNLAGNAVKFTNNGTVQLYVEKTNENDNTITLTVHIEDSGIGIDEKQKQRLFDPFTQAQSSNTREYGGTGLGLAISKSLVDVMGGSIWFESIPGEGTHFQFSLPFNKDKLSRSAAAFSPVLDRSSVCIVSEREGLRRVLSRYLEEWGGTVYVAGTPFGLPEHKAPSLVLVDGVGGVSETITALKDVIKRWDHQFHVFVVISPPDKEKIGELCTGIDCGYLFRPVRKAKLYDLITGAVSAPPYDGNSRGRLAERKPEKPENPEKPEKLSRTAHILIAEDNKINQKLTGRILSKHGYTFDIAKNGEEAVRAFQEKHYDLIIMDCQMPVVDGYMAALKIRRTQKRKVPIIALTANAMKGEREKVRAAGMDDYLSKPTDPQKMIQCIGKWLGRCGDYS